MRFLDDRLTAAGLPLSLPETGDAPCLLRILGLKSFLAPIAARPGRCEVQEDRIIGMLDALGLSGSLAPTDNLAGLLLALPLRGRPTAIGIIRTALQRKRVEAVELLAMARQLDDPAAADLFLDALQSSENRQRIEAMMGLVRFNRAADARLVLPLLASDTKEVAIHALYCLHRLGLLDDLMGQGELEPWLTGDHSEMLQALVEFAVEGDISPLPDLIGELDWEGRVALFRLCRSVAECEPNPDLFELLVKHGQDESDSDAAQIWSWAMAAAAPKGDFAGVEAILDLCGSVTEGGVVHCAALTSVGRLDLDEDQRQEAIERIVAMNVSDTDAKAAARIACLLLSPASASKAPGYDERLLLPGYSRLESCYADCGGEAAPDNTPVPLIPVHAALLTPTPGVNGPELMAALMKNEGSAPHLGLLAATLVTFHPAAIPVLDTVIVERSRPSDVRKAVAGPLLVCPHAIAAPPVLLRCLLGHAAGGPLPDDTMVFGALMAYTDDGDCSEAASAFMASANSEIRKFVAGYLDAKMAGETYMDRNQAKFRARLGVPPRAQGDMGTISAAMAMAAGLNVSSSTVLQLLRDDVGAGVGALRLLLASSRDREVQVSLSRDARVLGLLSDDQVAELWFAIAHSEDWIPRECAGVMAGVAGERLMNGVRGEEFANRVRELCDDSDSDVTTAAQEAAGRLGLV